MVIHKLQSLKVFQSFSIDFSTELQKCVLQNMHVLNSCTTIPCIIPVEKQMHFISHVSLRVVRDRGMFGTVTIFWQLFGNGSVLDTGQEFYNTSGTIVFENRERSKPITLHALSDKIPEFNEVYVLMLTNISGTKSIKGAVTNAVLQLILVLSA